MKESEGGKGLVKASSLDSGVGLNDSSETTDSVNGVNSWDSPSVLNFSSLPKFEILESEVEIGVLIKEVVKKI